MPDHVGYRRKIGQRRRGRLTGKAICSANGCARRKRWRRSRRSLRGGRGKARIARSPHRHCERSEAIHSLSLCCQMDCFAALAMTGIHQRSPDERSDIRGFQLPPVPHVAALMRATISVSMSPLLRPILALRSCWRLRRVIPRPNPCPRRPAHPRDQRFSRLSAAAAGRHPDRRSRGQDQKINVPAGGAEHMATLVKQLREGHKNTIFVAAGDLIGASPFLSAMFHDEPTIEVAVDDGARRRLRRQSRIRRGQGRIVADAEWRLPSRRTAARDRIRFSGAKFRYLAASTIEKSTGKPVFPAYEISNSTAFRSPSSG